MKSSITARPDLNWLRAFTFTIYGITVLSSSYFPLYFSYLGFSGSQIGYLYAVGPFISMFTNMFWSMTSDRYQTIRKIIMILLIGQLIMIIFLSNMTSFYGIFVFITLFNFFWYPLNPLTDTMAIQTAQKYGKNFIIIRVFGSIGYAFFALFIGYVLGAAGTSSTMLICMGVITLAFMFSTRLRDSKAQSKKKMKMSELWTILRQKELLWFFACVFCLAIPYRMNDAFIALTLKQLGANQSLIGWSMLASAVSEIPMFFLLSKYGDKFKELPLLAFASLMFALRFLFMSMTHEPSMIIVIQMMHSVTFGIYFVTAIRYLTRMIPDQFRATGLGLFAVVWSSAAGLMSGLFGGMIFENAGRISFYLVAVGLSFLAFIGFLSRHVLNSNGSASTHIDG